jgi:hypothetical protein
MTGPDELLYADAQPPLPWWRRTWLRLTARRRWKGWTPAGATSDEDDR